MNSRKWNSLLKKSSKFLLSEDFKERVIDEDGTMLSELKILSEINSLGYLTTESQKGKVVRFKKDGKRIAIKERAYITGLMKRNLAEKFIKNLNISTDKCALYNPIFCDSCKLVTPSDLDIPLTITYENDDVEVDTHMSSVVPYHIVLDESLGGAFSGMDCKEFLETGDIVYIFCWDHKWGRLAGEKKGLFTDVFRVLSSLKS